MFEEKFRNKKWIDAGTFKEVQIFENFNHIKGRLKDRYDLMIDEWFEWLVIKKSIILAFNEKVVWTKCSKKNPFQKGFTIHLTISNMWLSGIIQNDLDDGVKRVYFSTFLPECPKINSHDLMFDLPL